MSFDPIPLLISAIFGLIGTGYFMYGKSAGRMVPLGTGVVLMVFPYFLPNIIAMIIVGMVVTVVPFFVREG